MTLEQAQVELAKRDMRLLHRKLYRPDGSTSSEDWTIIEVGPNAQGKPIDTEGGTFYPTWQEAYTNATGRTAF